MKGSAPAGIILEAGESDDRIQDTENSENSGGNKTEITLLKRFQYEIIFLAFALIMLIRGTLYNLGIFNASGLDELISHLCGFLFLILAALSWALKMILPNIGTANGSKETSRDSETSRDPNNKNEAIDEFWLVFLVKIAIVVFVLAAIIVLTEIGSAITYRQIALPYYPPDWMMDEDLLFRLMSVSGVIILIAAISARGYKRFPLGPLARYWIALSVIIVWGIVVLKIGFNI